MMHTVLRAPRRLARTLLATALLATLVSCASTSPATGDPAGRERYSRVEFLRVSDNIAFRTRLSQSQLDGIGCSYATRNAVALQALHQLLDAYHLAPEASKRTNIDIRYALYIEKPDGSVDTLLLDRPYSGPDGKAIQYGTLNQQPVSVDGNLAPALMQWVAQQNLERFSGQFRSYC